MSSAFKKVLNSRPLQEGFLVSVLRSTFERLFCDLAEPAVSIRAQHWQPTSCSAERRALSTDGKLRTDLVLMSDFLGEGAHKLLGVDWSNAAYHARAEVFLDAVERRRLRGLQKRRLKLLAVGAIVDPLSRRRNPLAGGDDRCVPDDRNQFPVATCFDPQDAKARYTIVKRHALDRARQNFLRG
jgi:hypothetical protein